MSAATAFPDVSRMVRVDEIRWTALPDVPAPAPLMTVRLDHRRTARTGDDLVIAELAQGEAAALEQVATLQRGNRVLREVNSVALTQLTQTTAQLETARRTILALRQAERRLSPPQRPAA